MSGELAVDLGSTRTMVADPTGRILVDEPSVAAVDLSNGRLVAFGARAIEMSGRCAGQVGLVRPVAHGQLQDLELTNAVAALLLDQLKPRVGRRPEVLCSVAGLASGVQRRALDRAFRGAGASHVDFIEHAVAAGIGFRLEIDEPVATMVVDIGGGTTDVAVMALGGVVTESSIPLGGDDVNKAIRDLCLRSFDLIITDDVAEQVKRAIGTAWPVTEAKVEVLGRDSSNGMPRAVVLATSEVSGAIRDLVRVIVAAAVECIVTAPPDLANDLLSRGLYLAGGGALIDGLAKRLATAAAIPVHLSEMPTRAAVLGAARCLRALREPAERSQVVASGAVHGADAEDPPEAE